MFDLRYHLASLAAVFIALAVGILLGVAISGKLSAADTIGEAHAASRMRTRSISASRLGSSSRVAVKRIS